ncbi:hypothetical protein WJX72_010199 [[Myrmecia] bisecta]|uniref:TIR domain-containing protein n=1 Tax=[Myrmecia] bisecta TaxID=41462 RepID=A0AAW1NZM2_9CHLO
MEDLDKAVGRPTRVFICCAKQDVEQFAAPLWQGLKAAGFHPFVTELDVVPGMLPAPFSEHAVKNADAAVILFSEDLLATQEKLDELRQLVKRQKEARLSYLLPVYLTLTRHDLVQTIQSHMGLQDKEILMPLSEVAGIDHKGAWQSGPTIRPQTVDALLKKIVGVLQGWAQSDASVLGGLNCHGRLEVDPLYQPPMLLLDQISSVLSGATNKRVLLLAGPPGMGKSSLAKFLVAVHQQGGQFDDTVLVSWGHDEGCSHSSSCTAKQDHMLQTYMRLAGQLMDDQQMIHMHEPTLEAITAMIRKFLHSSRLLLVFDDVWDVEVLQRQLESVVDDGSSVADWASFEKQGAQQLIEQCDGSPLVMNLALGLLGSDKRNPLNWQPAALQLYGSIREDAKGQAAAPADYRIAYAAYRLSLRRLSSETDKALGSITRLDQASLIELRPRTGMDRPVRAEAAVRTLAAARSSALYSAASALGLLASSGCEPTALELVEAGAIDALVLRLIDHGSFAAISAASALGELAHSGGEQVIEQCRGGDILPRLGALPAPVGRLKRGVCRTAQRSMSDVSGRSLLRAACCVDVDAPTHGPRVQQRLPVQLARHGEAVLNHAPDAALQYDSSGASDTIGSSCLASSEDCEVAR